MKPMYIVHMGIFVGPILIFFFSPQFSPYFGKKTFLWAGEKTLDSHHLLFLSPFQTNTFQKVFPPYFSLSLSLKSTLPKAP